MNAPLAVRAVTAALVAGTLTLGVAAPALAQNGMENRQSQNGMENHQSRNEARMDRGATEQTLVERRITDLHERLHITSAQEPEWRAFTRTMRENARDVDRAYRRRAEEISQANALQNLESYERLERVRARDVQRLVQPFHQLYAALSPQQKQEADHLFRAYAEGHERRAQAASGR